MPGSSENGLKIGKKRQIMANTNKTITPKQKRAITALLNAPDKIAAAKVAGVGYRTLNRWLTDDLFLAELKIAEGELIACAVRSLIGDLEKNIETMKSIRDEKDTPDSVRLRAAQAIDSSLLKWRESLDIERRLEALEKVVLNK